MEEKMKKETEKYDYQMVDEILKQYLEKTYEPIPESAYLVITAIPQEVGSRYASVMTGFHGSIDILVGLYKILGEKLGHHVNEIFSQEKLQNLNPEEIKM